MEDCGSRYGSVIEEVSGTGIESLISAEKLRGTDLYLGPTTTSKSGFWSKIHTGLNFRRSGVSLWGPHAVHGWI